MEVLERNDDSLGDRKLSCKLDSSSDGWITTDDESDNEWEFRGRLGLVATKAITGDSDYEEESIPGCGQMIPHPLEDLMPKAQWSLLYESGQERTAVEDLGQTHIASFLDGPKTLWEEPPVENVLVHPGNGENPTLPRGRK
jgi:hypothetical protein